MRDHAVWVQVVRRLQRFWLIAAEHAAVFRHWQVLVWHGYKGVLLSKTPNVGGVACFVHSVFATSVCAAI
jgi:hypothetical protein